MAGFSGPWRGKKHAHWERWPQFIFFSYSIFVPFYISEIINRIFLLKKYLDICFRRCRERHLKNERKFSKSKPIIFSANWLSTHKKREMENMKCISDKEPVLPCCGKSRKNIHHSTALDELNPKMYFIFAKWQFRDFRKPIDFATQDSTFRFEMTWTGMRNVMEWIWFSFSGLVV